MFGKRRERLTTQRTVSAMKHGGGSMMLKECFSASGSGEFCEGGNNYKERRIYEDSERKLQAVSSKTGPVSYSSHSFNKTKNPNWPVQSPELNPIRVDLRSIPEEHQIWRTPRDLPKENGLGLLMRCL